MRKKKIKISDEQIIKQHPVIFKSNYDDLIRAGADEKTARKIAIEKTREIKAIEDKKKVVKAKKVDKIEIVDFNKIKGTRIEYFDDRFYRVTLPENIDKQWIENVPENFIYPSDTPNFLDVYLPSVTTIQGHAQPRPFLERWRGDVGNWEADRRSEEALGKGRRIHNACELLQNGYAIIYQNNITRNISDKEIRAFAKRFKCKTHLIHTQEEMIQVARFDRLFKLILPEIKETENSVLNLKECYAGTVDALWNVKGGDYKMGRNSFVLEDGYYIVDFKTGKWFSDDDYFTQLAAYTKAHLLNDKLKGCIIIHLNANIKSGIEGLKVYVKTIQELEPYYEHFRDLNKIFQFNNKEVIPKLYEFPQVLLWGKKGNK